MPKLTLGFKAIVNVYGSLCMSALHRRIRCLVAMMLPPRWNTGIYNKNITLKKSVTDSGENLLCPVLPKGGFDRNPLKYWFTERKEMKATWNLSSMWYELNWWVYLFEWCRHVNRTLPSVNLEIMQVVPVLFRVKNTVTLIKISLLWRNVRQTKLWCKIRYLSFSWKVNIYRVLSLGRDWFNEKIFS